ncbi:unnamed protein product [Polarella glacialis]|uniref:Phosphoacetylglucosamine mutase n=1 Tax=Polarella glacialis TaxID=89957 RepID=A0A813GPQ6_POLGL|nr:unnamed protein product [Polarella glacialis]
MASCVDTLEFCGNIDHFNVVEALKGEDDEDIRRPSVRSKGTRKPLLFSGGLGSQKMHDGGDLHAKVTALMAAAQYGSANSIWRLIMKEGEDPEDRDVRGWTAMHYAAHYGHLDVFAELLRCSADPTARDNRSKTPLQVAQAADKEFASKLEKLISGWALEASVASATCVSVNLKQRRFSPLQHCHHAALDFDVGIYFEANGHGTVIFSAAFVQAVGYVASGEGTYQSMATLREARNSAGQLLLFRDLINEAVGDAISNFLAVEAILRLLDWDADKWRDMYDDLPNRQIKVVVSDRSIFETTDAERICVKPEGLQAQIDELVQKVPKGRSFVRPSGTEDCVRVYVEAETLQATLELGQAVVDLVYAKAGGVGNKPVVA